MKAAVFESFSAKPTIQNVADPSPSDDGVIVKVNWWSQGGSHPGPRRCQRSAHPAELWPQNNYCDALYEVELNVQIYLREFNIFFDKVNL